MKEEIFIDANYVKKCKLKGKVVDLVLVDEAEDVITPEGLKSIAESFKNISICMEGHCNVCHKKLANWEKETCFDCWFELNKGEDAPWLKTKT